MSNNFKVGDKVRLLRKVQSHTEGWLNSWIPEMDKAVGQVGTVSRVRPASQDVSVNFDSVKTAYSGNGYGYPAFALELVQEPKLLPVVGARVKVTYISAAWQYEGVIEKAYTNSASVRMLAGPYKGELGLFNHDELVVLSAPVSGVLQSQPAIAPASTQSTIVPDGTVASPIKSLVLSTAKNIARQIARANSIRRVTMDQVQSELANSGYTSADLGNSAGSVFKGNDWRNTGVTVKSTRDGNNARRIIVWEYIGS